MDINKDSILLNNDALEYIALGLAHREAFSLKEESEQ